MSWKIIEKHRKILAAESGAVLKGWGGKLTVCLVYPNRYHTAMSNLGFQTVYAILNSYPDILCERAFLPDADEMREYGKSRSALLSLESQRPLADFDVVAFSISFESDYLHIPEIFRLSGIPPFSAERDSSNPLVMAGGAAMFLNPEPAADFMDMICVGEAEPLLPGLLGTLRSWEQGTRRALLEAISQLPGIYVPAMYEPCYDGPRLVSLRPLNNAPSRVKRVWEEELDNAPTASVILTPDTEFGEMRLVEISRGCPHGCRFCAAGYIYHPYRQRSLGAVKDMSAKAANEGRKIGLVGAAVSDYRGIGELSTHILESGGKVSVSSLRIDGLNSEMIDVLKASGHKTVALAPEGGSQRLRDLIKKDITEEQILAACDLLIGKDILNLKLYFIIGLPTERGEDLDELVGLVSRVRERVIDAARKNRRVGEIVLSVNPFVPKPFTPFQWCGMEGVKSLEKKGKYLQDAFRRLSNVRMKMESPKDAYVQALLSRGDRRLSRLILDAGGLSGLRRAAREMGLDTDLLVQRDIPLDELLPWDVIEGVDKGRLLQEYGKAFGGVV